jgi:hypothetical protein
MHKRGWEVLPIDVGERRWYIEKDSEAEGWVYLFVRGEGYGALVSVVFSSLLLYRLQIGSTA